MSAWREWYDGRGAPFATTNTIGRCVALRVIITEGALFHDWAGTSSPAHPSALFRWGPFHMPFTAALDGIGVGPLTSQIVLLRIVHLAALAALFGLESLLQQTTDDDRNSAARA